MRMVISSDLSKIRNTMARTRVWRNFDSLPRNLCCTQTRGISSWPISIAKCKNEENSAFFLHRNVQPNTCQASVCSGTQVAREKAWSRHDWIQVVHRRLCQSWWSSRWWAGMTSLAWGTSFALPIGASICSMCVSITMKMKAFCFKLAWACTDLLLLL